MNFAFVIRPARRTVLIGAAALISGACRPEPKHLDPAVEFTRLPVAAEGSSDITAVIEGRVTGAQKGQRIVLYAKSGAWWVQPLVRTPFTTIGSDSSWKSSTHPGTEYAALLVDEDYTPAAIADTLPQKGGKVAAIATAYGATPSAPPANKLQFSGFEWEIGHSATNPGGTLNNYDPANAWVDERGLLHLRIARKGEGWTSAQITSTQSLGYGKYRFVVRDMLDLDPSAVLGLALRENSSELRELDIELSRWGEQISKNAQYVVQPFYVAENSIRFMVPAGTLDHSIDWKPRQVKFETRHETTQVASHVFTSDIPVAGTDSVNINLYVFGSNPHPLFRDTEVVIEKFEFLP